MLSLVDIIVAVVKDLCVNCFPIIIKLLRNSLVVYRNHKIYCCNKHINRVCSLACVCAHAPISIFDT
jgi:hypothetical protein